jgi:hypothetical protein
MNYVSFLWKTLICLGWFRWIFSSAAPISWSVLYGIWGRRLCHFALCFHGKGLDLSVVWCLKASWGGVSVLQRSFQSPLHGRWSWDVLGCTLRLCKYISRGPNGECLQLCRHRFLVKCHYNFEARIVNITSQKCVDSAVTLVQDDFIIFSISVARCASSVSDLIAGKGVSTAAVSWLFNHDILVLHVANNTP